MKKKTLQLYIEEHNGISRILFVMHSIYCLSKPSTGKNNKQSV